MFRDVGEKRRNAFSGGFLFFLHLSLAQCIYFCIFSLLYFTAFFFILYLFFFLQHTQMPDSREEHAGIIEKLTSAFLSQSINHEPIIKPTRPNRQSTTTPPPPTLRKRSSGSYRSQQENTPEVRKRDSNGINYANFVNAFNNSSHEQPLFTMKQDEPLPSNTPKSNNNKGRVSKRSSFNSVPIINNNNNQNPHGGGGNALSNTIKETQSIEPSQLGTLIESIEPPLLIDMRPLEEYEKSRVQHSINVSLPGLLMKRYRRGVVSNFNLETFITTPEGTDLYQRWRNRYNVQDNNIQNLPEGAVFIVYDDQMTEDTTTAVWTLMAVIAKNNGNVKWLKGGFYGFLQWDKSHLYISSPSPFTPIPDLSMKKQLLFKPNKLKMPTPMISRSATTLSSKTNQPLNINVQRRASLFSLDTSTLRKNHTNNKRIDDKHSGGTSSDLSSIHEKTTAPIFSPTTPLTTASSPDIFHTPLEQIPTTAAGESTPRVDGEFDFVISEIIPHFLYLGPEIATVDQLSGLESRSIQRILNMAEECDDDVPGLKEAYKYQKIAARDTVEMQNVQGTLKKAVQAIGKHDFRKYKEGIG